MDSIRSTVGAPPPAPIQAQAAPGPAPRNEESPAPAAPQDRVTVGGPEAEKDSGNIPNFGAAFGAQNANAGAPADGPQNGTNGNANQLDPTGMPKASAADEEMARHVCAGSCGCISSTPGQGTNALKALEERDQEVRQHEQEHLNEAGEHARGGPTFETYSASNGKTFVTGGKVNVDVSEVAGDPRKTADKMAKIRKAALAPKTPSQQDRMVESEAASKESAARAQMQQDDLQKGRAPGSPGSATGPAV